MRIGIVCYPTYGGSGAAAVELGRHLAKNGHVVHVVSSSRPFRLDSSSYQENLYFHEIPTVEYAVLKSDLYTLSTAVTMAELVDSEGLDILHNHYAVPHAVSSMLARCICSNTKVRIVTTLHGTDITLVGCHPAFAPAIRMGIESSDAVVAVSRWLAAQTQERFPLVKPCQVIYNFVDTEAFRPRPENAALRERFAAASEKIVMHISNFRPVKRVGDVVRTFARIVREVPSILVMAGDGPELHHARSLVRELGLTDRVRFVGLQNDIPLLLSMADLFLFPSEYESFGLAALEAMACEVPVISTTGGGIPEVIEHGKTGCLHAVGDVDGMAQCAIELLSNPSKAREIGQAARQRVIDAFNPRIAIEAYETLYRSLM